MFWLRTRGIQKDLQFLQLQIEERAEMAFFTYFFIQVASIWRTKKTLHSLLYSFWGFYKTSIHHYSIRVYAIESLKPVKRRPPLHKMSVQCPRWGLQMVSFPFLLLGTLQQLLHLSKNVSVKKKKKSRLTYSGKYSS